MQRLRDDTGKFERCRDCGTIQGNSKEAGTAGNTGNSKDAGIASDTGYMSGISRGNERL